MKHTISATEASRQFSHILNMVHYQGESYDIKRGKEVIAQIVPVATQKVTMKVSDLNHFFKNIPSLGEDADSFEQDILKTRAEQKNIFQEWDLLKKSAPLGSVLDILSMRDEGRK